MRGRPLLEQDEVEDGRAGRVEQRARARRPRSRRPSSCPRSPSTARRGRRGGGRARPSAGPRRSRRARPSTGPASGGARWPRTATRPVTTESRSVVSSARRGRLVERLPRDRREHVRERDAVAGAGVEADDVVAEARLDDLREAARLERGRGRGERRVEVASGGSRGTRRRSWSRRGWCCRGPWCSGWRRRRAWPGRPRPSRGGRPRNARASARAAALGAGVRTTWATRTSSGISGRCAAGMRSNHSWTSPGVVATARRRRAR